MTASVGQAHAILLFEASFERLEYLMNDLNWVCLSSHLLFLVCMHLMAEKKLQGVIHTSKLFQISNSSEALSTASSNPCFCHIRMNLFKINCLHGIPLQTDLQCSGSKHYDYTPIGTYYSTPSQPICLTPIALTGAKVTNI